MLHKSMNLAAMQSLSMLHCSSLVNISACEISRYRRKNGLYSYKLGKNMIHKNVGAMDMHAKQQLKKQGYDGQLKINERERLSTRVFGTHSRRGKFQFEIEKVPFYNVPDLEGFKLKPYVPHNTPLIPEDLKV